MNGAYIQQNFVARLESKINNLIDLIAAWHFHDGAVVKTAYYLRSVMYREYLRSRRMNGPVITGEIGRAFAPIAAKYVHGALISEAENASVRL